LFIQKSHDHHLTDPVPEDVDLVLVQVREPTFRVLSNYELDLEVHKLKHTNPLLQFFLAQEAIYVTGFSNKWMKSEIAHRLLVRYEDLLADPGAALSGMLSAVGFDSSPAAVEKGAALIRVSSRDRTTEFTERTFESSKYFVKPYLKEYLDLLFTEANY